MKTLKIILSAVGLLCLNAAFSFTVLNVPIDELTEQNTEKTLSYLEPLNVMEVVVSDNTNVKENLLRDTILIDLSQENLAGPFPSASKDCIMNQIPYPEFARARQLEGGVAVRFMFDESGNVQVLEACSNSPELEQYVRAKLAQLQLKNCVADMNTDYYLRFMFRLF